MQQELGAIYDIVENCLNSIDYNINIVDYRNPMDRSKFPEDFECDIEDIEEMVLLPELQEYGKQIIELFIEDMPHFWLHIDGECIEATPILNYNFDTGLLSIKIYADSIDDEVKYNWSYAICTQKYYENDRDEDDYL
jgi:hypothetical protein